MLQICRDAGELAERAAALVLQAAGRAIAAEGRFTLCLAGGDTPRAVYRRLSSAALEWKRVHLFWGDERAVPPDDPQSNFRMVKEELLSRAQVPEENVHRILAEKPAEQAAAAYEDELRQFFGGWPGFHLALLGLGADGHTASLFPGSPALAVTDRAVVAASGRISLTAPALNRAAWVVFLVGGEQKAAALRAVLEGPPNPRQFPAQLIRPESGNVTWLVDAPAASLLARSGASEEQR